MLLYNSTPPEDQWEWVGKCVECGANLYRKESRLRPDCRVEDGHLCRIEEEGDEAGDFSCQGNTEKHTDKQPD